MKTSTTPTVRLVIAGILAAGCIGLLAGCGSKAAIQTQNEALLPEIDVVQVKENSEEALKLAQEAKLDVQMMSSKLIDMDNKMVLLQEDVSSVSAAKIEELDNRISLLVEALKNLQAQISAIEVLPQVKVNPQKVHSPTFSPTTASSILGTTTEYELYQNALRVYNGREFKKAIDLLADVLKQYPKGTYADNCLYWTGECFFSLSDFAQAVSFFKQTIAFPRSSKNDDAQMKLALSYLKMGQSSAARSEFKKLLDIYPGSEYVARVRKYLEEMN